MIKKLLNLIFNRKGPDKVINEEINKEFNKGIDQPQKVSSDDKITIVPQTPEIPRKHIKLKVNDERKEKTSLIDVNIADEYDPALSAILNAAWSGKSCVIGTIDDKGELTIKDAD